MKEYAIGINTNEFRCPKTNIGVKAVPQLKHDLSTRAAALGISLSEYCETLLLNSNNTNREVEKLREQVSQLQALLSQHKAEAEKLRIDNSGLQKRMKEADDQVTLLNDPRLLRMYEELKGKNDKIITQDGQSFSITYNTPKDLLKAFIYSYKIKR